MEVSFYIRKGKYCPATTTTTTVATENSLLFQCKKKYLSKILFCFRKVIF